MMANAAIQGDPAMTFRGKHESRDRGESLTDVDVRGASVFYATNWSMGSLKGCITFVDRISLFHQSSKESSTFLRRSKNKTAACS